jgi:hypothetical protein
MNISSVPIMEIVMSDSGLFGGYDPQAFRVSLEGPGSQEPKYPGTTTVGESHFTPTTRLDHISLPTPPWPQQQKLT